MLNIDNLLSEFRFKFHFSQQDKANICAKGVKIYYLTFFKCIWDINLKYC